jgi:hypothetical protein
MKQGEQRRACSTHGQKDKFIKRFSKNTRRKEPLGRPWRRWENDGKMDLKERVLDCVYLIQLDQDRHQRWTLLNTLMKFRFHKILGIS